MQLVDYGGVTERRSFPRSGFRSCKAKVDETAPGGQKFVIDSVLRGPYDRGRRLHKHSDLIQKRKNLETTFWGLQAPGTDVRVS